MDIPTTLFKNFREAVVAVVVMRVVAIALIIVAAVIIRLFVQRAVKAGVTRAMGTGEDAARVARLKTLGGLMNSAAAYAILFVAGLMILDKLGLDTKAVLTTAGVLGLAVGLGSQRLVRDVIGGFFILLENQFSVGEMVTLGGVNVTGTVQEMGLRVTKLRDDVGRLVMLGNGDITVVTNHSRGPLTINVDATLAADTDLNAVRQAVADAANTLPADAWAQSPRLLGLVEAPEGKIKVRIAGQSTPGNRDAAEMSLRSALRETFSQHHISA